MAKDFSFANFADKYIENYNEIMDLDDSLLRPMAYAQWKTLIVNRSARIREIFRENDEMIAQLKIALQEKLTEEAAEDLYGVVSSLYECAVDDYGLIKMICEVIIPYYEERNAFEQLIYLYHIMGFESYEFQGRILGEEGCEEAIYYFQKIQKYSERYGEVTQERTRKCFYTANNNLIAPIAQTYPKLREKIFEYYRVAKELYQSEIAQQLDGGKEEFECAIEQIEEDILFADDYIWECGEEFQEEFTKFVEQVELQKPQDYTKESGALIRAKMICQILKDPSKKKAVVEWMIEYIKQLPVPDYKEPEDMKDLLYLLNLHNSGSLVLNVLKDEIFSKEEKEKYLSRFIKKITDEHLKVPYDYCTITVNQVCMEWYKEIVEFLNGFELKKEYLLQLIICRQPTTYIHSQMVKEVAILLGNALLKDYPQLFVGILDCSTQEEVKLHSREIISYVEECGLLHDVGKCNVVELINKQSRRLTQEEFNIIKKHTTMGTNLLGNNGDFRKYYDVMEGHHKSYDGTFGYPENFNNVERKEKIIIDLITIADCIDAATDTLGRNYAKGKNFVTLAQELKEGAGSRYNPYIVECIFNNKVLWDNLEYITDEGRGQIYYRVYQDILMLGHESKVYSGS